LVLGWLLNVMGKIEFLRIWFVTLRRGRSGFVGCLLPAELFGGRNVLCQGE
jgi:hypothetical protein